VTFIPHIRFSANGTLGTNAVPPEIFSFGLSFGPGGDFGALDIPGSTVRTAVESAVSTMFGSASSYISPSAKITSYKWAKIGSDGLYLEPPVIDIVNVVGGSVGTVPPQIAMCVTLDGPPAVRRITGRYYLPMCVAAATATDLVISTANRTSILGTQVTMLNAINTAFNADPGPTDKLRVVVASQGRTSPPSGPSSPSVRRVRLGVVLDTQRRRRNNLVEAYAATDLA